MPMNFASVYNFYEHLVFEYIVERLQERYPDEDEEFFLDVACYALTKLPARYIRHEIDMAYYLQPGERAEMMRSVAEETMEAAKYIEKNKESRAAS